MDLKLCKVNNRILIYAIRYAMGRMTFAPTDAIEAFKDNIDNFMEWEIKTIIEEIELLGKVESLGMKCDHDTWINFKNYLINYLENETYK